MNGLDETRKDSRRPSPRHGAPRLLLGLGLLALAACGSAPKRPQEPSNPPPRAEHGRAGVIGHAAQDVLFLAISLVGTPYRFGGNTPEGGFDCSGLIGYVFREAAALALPRTTRELKDMRGREVRRTDLASGDLVFFGARGRVNHAGIYVGEGRFVHAPSSGGTVRLDALDGHYWRDHYLGAKRIL
ncbi:Cell wall-associated hydrolase, NlpC family [Aquimonas voraii]|uniref:Cell wall-associated hydrolase, NlpC family n=1 Tax=Aquimonas voraii TaxID=265719 RepID=A0A1G6UR55_9GAMM|nr:Cell wall-associated hydrolase, NlpC family [Aquimonas voraii]